MGGVKPVGFRFNFGPHSRIQPFLDSHLGFLAALRDVPVDNSSAMNFTFEFGAGLEIFREHGRSIVLEFRLHHLSNAYAGDNNPGVDNQLVHVGYSFGKYVGQQWKPRLKIRPDASR
jgi:hypothetical protein